MVTGKEAITVRFQASTGMLVEYTMRLLRKDMPVNEGVLINRSSCFSVYNQHNGIVKLSFGTKDPSRKITIYTLSGKRVIEMEAVSESLVFNNKPGKIKKGVYAIQMVSKNQITSRKVHLF